MNWELQDELNRLETDLWDRSRGLLVLPRETPDEIRLTILRDVLADHDFMTELDDLEVFVPDSPCEIHICSGFCPDCPILSWCEMAQEEYEPEQLEWMHRTQTWPPAVEYQMESEAGSASR